MMSRSGGLKPKAVAGKPSVTKLTHNSWTGIRASGMPSAAVRKILPVARKNTGQMGEGTKNITIQDLTFSKLLDYIF